MPDLTITTSAGYTLNFDPVPFPFRAETGSAVVIPTPDVPGIQFGSPGIYPVDPGSNWVRGTLEMLFTLPAAGTARALLFLANSRTSPTAYVGFGIDASNRPFTLIKDAGGTTVGQTTSSSAALLAGTSLLVRLRFDSARVVQGARLAYLEAPSILKSWSTNPITPWAPMVPECLFVGTGLDGLADFTGTIKTAFVSALVGAVPLNDEGEVIPDTSTMAGSSGLAASLKVKYPADSTLAGSSGLAASIKVERFLASTLAGESDLTADLTLTP